MSVYTYICLSVCVSVSVCLYGCVCMSVYVWTHLTISRSSQCSTTGVKKGRGMCYPVCGMMHIKQTLLLIGKSSPCGGRGFSLSLYEWSFTICLTPYNHKYNVLSMSLNKHLLPSFTHSVSYKQTCVCVCVCVCVFARVCVKLIRE